MKLYETHELARQWMSATGLSLYRFILPLWLVNGDCMLDMEKLERWLQPADNESISQALTRQYGEKANNVIKKLLSQ